MKGRRAQQAEDREVKEQLGVLRRAAGTRRFMDRASVVKYLVSRGVDIRLAVVTARVYREAAL